MSNNPKTFLSMVYTGDGKPSHYLNVGLDPKVCVVWCTYSTMKLGGPRVLLLTKRRDIISLKTESVMPYRHTRQWYLKGTHLDVGKLELDNPGEWNTLNIDYALIVLG